MLYSDRTFASVVPIDRFEILFDWIPPLVFFSLVHDKWLDHSIGAYISDHLPVFRLLTVIGEWSDIRLIVMPVGPVISVGAFGGVSVIVDVLAAVFNLAGILELCRFAVAFVLFVRGFAGILLFVAHRPVKLLLQLVQSHIVHLFALIPSGLPNSFYLDLIVLQSFIVLEMFDQLLSNSFGSMVPEINN